MLCSVKIYNMYSSKYNLTYIIHRVKQSFLHISMTSRAKGIMELLQKN